MIAIIQARMSSSRLPGKVLLPLGDGLVLDQVVKRARLFAEQVVVCTSTDPDDQAIEEHCEQRGVVCVRGPLDDVFERYRLALSDPRVRRCDWFARVTGDCPLLSPELARFLMGNIEASDHYLCVRHEALPRGLTAEFIKTEAFLRIDAAQLDPPEREHVTLHLYENPELYRCRFLDPPIQLRYPELRLTLDYQEDYMVLQELFAGAADITAEEAILRLNSDQELRSKNAHCFQKVAR
ncbi:MAG: spore coat protein [Rickettsiales bacterium]|nr:spore coat protein [Rickettsiales bacterium]